MFHLNAIYHAHQQLYDSVVLNVDLRRRPFSALHNSKSPCRRTAGATQGEFRESLLEPIPAYQFQHSQQLKPSLSRSYATMKTPVPAAASSHSFRPLRRGSRLDYGKYIYIYNHVRTGQVVYSTKLTLDVCMAFVSKRHLLIIIVKAKTPYKANSHTREEP